MQKVRDEIETLIDEGGTMLKDGLKDGIRGARHMLRQGAARGAHGDPVSRGVSSLVRRVDGVLTRAERKTLSLLRPALAQAGAGSLIAGFASLLTEDDAILGRRFVETQYRLAKAVLRHWGVAGAFVSEQIIRQAFQALMTEERALISDIRRTMRAGDEARRRAAVTEFAAASALAIMRRDPVRALSPLPEGRALGLSGASASARSIGGDALALPSILGERPSLATFLAVALAVSGYAQAGNEESEPEDFLASAAAIVEARFDRLAACRTGPDLAAALRKYSAAMP